MAIDPAPAPAAPDARDLGGDVVAQADAFIRDMDAAMRTNYAATSSRSARTSIRSSIPKPPMTAAVHSADRRRTSYVKQKRRPDLRPGESALPFPLESSDHFGLRQGKPPQAMAPPLIAYRAKVDGRGPDLQ